MEKKLKVKLTETEYRRSYNAFTKAQDDYRNRKIDDKTYLAARASHWAMKERFDAYYRQFYNNG